MSDGIAGGDWDDAESDFVAGCHLHLPALEERPTISLIAHRGKLVYRRASAIRVTDGREKNRVAQAAAPSAWLMSTSSDEPHPLDSVAALATILNDVAAISVRGAFLNVH